MSWSSQMQTTLNRNPQHEAMYLQNFHRVFIKTLGLTLKEIPSLEEVSPS